MRAIRTQFSDQKPKRRFYRVGVWCFDPRNGRTFKSIRVVPDEGDAPDARGLLERVVRELENDRV